MTFTFYTHLKKKKKEQSPIQVAVVSTIDSKTMNAACMEGHSFKDDLASTMKVLEA